MHFLRKNIFANSAGFSLMEVMLAAGMMGILSAALIAVMKMGFSGQKAVQSADESSRLTAEMANVLANPTACMNTFGGRNPPGGFTVSQIRNVSNAVLYQTNAVYGNRTVRLFSIETGGSGTDARTQLPRYNATSSTAGTALVKVTWRKMADAAGPQELHRFFFLNVTLNGGGLVTACSAQSTLAEEIWQRSGVDPSTIYYNGGKVGIGTLAPKVKLEVDGAIKVGTQTVCDTDAEGAIRYNSTAKNIEFCNGNSWMTIGDNSLTWF